jgi:hypothetical protein
MHITITRNKDHNTYVMICEHTMYIVSAPDEDRALDKVCKNAPNLKKKCVCIIKSNDLKKLKQIAVNEKKS